MSDFQHEPIITIDGRVLKTSEEVKALCPECSPKPKPGPLELMRLPQPPLRSAGLIPEDWCHGIISSRAGESGGGF